MISSPPPEEDEEEYIVENIVKKNFNARLGQYEFLVKWKGYSAKHNVHGNLYPTSLMLS